MVKMEHVICFPKLNFWVQKLKLWIKNNLQEYTYSKNICTVNINLKFHWLFRINEITFNLFSQSVEKFLNLINIFSLHWYLCLIIWNVLQKICILIPLLPNKLQFIVTNHNDDIQHKVFLNLSEYCIIHHYKIYF